MHLDYPIEYVEDARDFDVIHRMLRSIYEQVDSSMD